MTTTSQHPAYQPSGDELLIFEFAKMQGKTQSQVASFFGINQSTVSRIIHRIERWQAHAKARENGRLDPHERLRAQRWLTYERNELILASCLRIAHEMEGFTELSKSTISRPVDNPCQKHEIRTEGRTIDRHGVAARFLRLAWRINMDQLKLTELLAREGDAREGEAPAELLPLTDAELAAEAHQAALDAAELAAARQPAEDLCSRHTPCDEPTDRDAMLPPSPLLMPDREGPPSPGQLTIAPTHDASMHPVHNLHNENVLEITTTPNDPCTCRLQTSSEKNSLNTCITEPKEFLSSAACDSADTPELQLKRSAVAVAAVEAT